MENTHKDLYGKMRMGGEVFIQSCLADIKKTICQYPNATLSFGNTTLFVKDEVVYGRVNNNRPFELYSEDGYDTAEDIAHWADVVADVDKCYKSGRNAYTLNWNS